jgi:hypothetical protein
MSMESDHVSTTEVANPQKSDRNDPEHTEDMSNTAAVCPEALRRYADAPTPPGVRDGSFF